MSFALSIVNELCAMIINRLHEDGVYLKKDVIFHASAFAKGTITAVRLAPIIDRVPPIYEVQNTLKEMSLFSYTDKYHAKG